MNSYQKRKCHKIIHAASASTAAIGAGLAQIPGSDAVPITGIQIGMVISLGSVFGVALSESAAQGLLKGFIAAGVGRLASQSLTWVPVIGNVINAATAASITEALGWRVAKKFDRETSQSFKP